MKHFNVTTPFSVALSHIFSNIKITSEACIARGNHKSQPLYLAVDHTTRCVLFQCPFPVPSASVHGRHNLLLVQRAECYVTLEWRHLLRYLSHQRALNTRYIRSRMIRVEKPPADSYRVFKLEMSQVGAARHKTKKNRCYTKILFWQCFIY